MDDIVSLLGLSLKTKDPILIRYGEMVLDQFARKTDSDINDRLLRQLIMEYAVVERELSDAMGKLTEANLALSLLSSQDGLTGLSNRRRFDEFLGAEWLRARREGWQISLLIGDIDHFKLFNDHYGHQGGDDCLKQVAGVIGKAAQRPTDLAARYGEEEFALVLAQTPLEGALVAAREIAAKLAAMRLPHAESPTAPCVTLSMGIACMTPTAAIDSGELIKQADLALYAAKRNGRNRVETAASIS
ncbi:MAG: diguanylate cyclase [Spirochaetota bacterium]